jgi:hypothetical protein
MLELVEILNQEEIDCVFPVADVELVRNHLSKFTANGHGFESVTSASLDVGSNASVCCGAAQCIGGPC